MYKEFPPGDFGNLRLPRDHIARTRELRYEGEGHDQVLSYKIFIIFPGGRGTSAIWALNIYRMINRSQVRGLQR